MGILQEVSFIQNKIPKHKTAILKQGALSFFIYITIIHGVMLMSQPKRRKAQFEITRSIRGSWNGVNPVTKVVPDKTKYTRKEKHKRQL